jgi:hypothetical protein
MQRTQKSLLVVEKISAHIPLPSSKLQPNCIMLFAKAALALAAFATPIFASSADTKYVSAS